MQPQTQSSTPPDTTPMRQEVPTTPTAATPATPQVPRVTIQAEGLPLADGTRPTTPARPVTWQAKEYITPEKNIAWYVGLFLVVAAGIAIDIFFLQAWTVSLLLVAIAAVLIVMTVRPSRDITYELSSKGLRVGDQLYSLSDYKAFGVIHDGKENSIFLIPVKRFKPGLSVYFPVESGEQIVELLGHYLPMQEIRLDFIDKVVRMLRL
ncbi:MAG: hypothetical protein Q4B06_03875 [Candidatus Saccharibacteria bacterium]|nr:hypothetical protein [Candidatus Saccharibacteria bacterium]